MAADDEIAMMLPEPPPPRPDRRAATIAEAMRRFDGIDAPVPAASPRRPPVPRPAWAGISRGQIGMIASVALVAVIAIPIAIYSPDRNTPSTRQQASADSVGRPAAAARSSAPPASPVPVSARTPGPNLAQAPEPPPAIPSRQRLAANDAAPETGNREVAGLPAPVVAPAPAPAVAPDAKVAQAKAEPALEARGTASRFERADRSAQAAPAAPPPAMAADTADIDNDGANIVVTGSRASPAYSRRGDWNACTVNDPAHNLSSCRRQVDSGAKGTAGRADAHLATGLSLAWEGDMEGAIAAFDQAIQMRPRHAFAYLNRGLAYQRDGDIDRALRDIDRAVRYAPNDARGYFYRSLILREKGDARGARADAARAIEIDFHYRAVLK